MLTPANLRRSAAIVAVVALLCAPTAVSAGSRNLDLLVKFHTGAPAGQIDQALRTIGGRQRGLIPALAVRIVSVPSNRASSALETLHRSRYVVYAEQDALLG